MDAGSRYASIGGPGRPPPPADTGTLPDGPVARRADPGLRPSSLRLPIFLWLLLIGSSLLLTACEGAQSALDPAGRGAEQIAHLFWWLLGGGVVVWLAVIGLAVYAIRLHPEAHSPRTARFLIIGGGGIFPAVVLAGYLIYGLALMPDLLAPAPAGSLQITVTGEQWWWRVHYETPNGAVVLANELHLPVGERVAVRLESPDVIHAFWVPALGGKIDMIPGRVNRLALEPTRTGVYRGACAEYCGLAHALMSFYVVVEPRADFDRWLAHQATPAPPPASADAARGAALFVANGCGACHAVRGTAADGVVGPDLTHVGSRHSLGAGILANDAEAFLQWLVRTEAIKPGVHMPAFAMLPAADLEALAHYLESLQ